MGIFQRVADICSANFNDLVERWEDPEKMLRQAIREMDVAIDKAKPEVAKAMANATTVKKEADKNRAQVQAWQDRAADAVRSGDDAAARDALNKKQEFDKLVSALESQHQAADEAATLLRQQYDGMKDQHAEAERQLGTLVARQKAAEAKGKLATSGADIGSPAFDKFDRMKQKVERAEAEAEAMAELASSEKADSISLDPDVERELRALKEQLGN